MEAVGAVGIKPKKSGKKVLKIIGIAFLCIICVIILAVLICFIVHKCLSASERKLLDRAGLVNHVSAGDYNLNAYIYGSDNPKHTIVGISGLGVSDYSVTLGNVCDSLAEENKIAIIDRAGYGISDDTTKPQTVDRIVDDYRTVLKNSGLEAPYILMPHSIGGVYATHWQYKYPEEIEAVIYIDPTQIGSLDFLEEEPEAWDADIWDYLSALACKAGLHREYYLFQKLKLWGGVPDDILDCSKALCMNQPYSFAMYSEGTLEKENITKVHNELKPNDIPKLYLSSSFLNEETVEEDFKAQLGYINSIYDSFGMDRLEISNDPEKVKELSHKLYESSVELNEKSILPYVERLGNCTLVSLAGDHMLYLQKPDEVLRECGIFLNTLDAGE